VSEHWPQGEEWSAALLRPALPLPFTALAGNVMLQQGRAILLGYTIHAVGGGGTVTFYDGQDATGLLVAVFGLPAGGSAIAPPTTPGVRLEIGLFMTQSGFTNLTGCAYIVPIEDPITRLARHKPAM
jgi:hypothetical protein